MAVTRNFFSRSLHHKRPTRGGFSLIEMLVVIAIIAVLAAIAFPVFGRMRSSAQAATCTSNLRTLHQASMNYAADNGGLFPMAINPTDNFAITLACQGYLGLSGSGYWERLNSWVGLSQRRAPFALWCPAAEACEARAPLRQHGHLQHERFCGGRRAGVETERLPHAQDLAGYHGVENIALHGRLFRFRKRLRRSRWRVGSSTRCDAPACALQRQKQSRALGQRRFCRRPCRNAAHRGHPHQLQ